MTPFGFDRGRRQIHEIVERVAPSVSVMVLARPFGHYDVEILGPRGSCVIDLDEEQLARLAVPTVPAIIAMETRIGAVLAQIGERTAGSRAQRSAQS
jgi:hypothetical protein